MFGLFLLIAFLLTPLVLLLAGFIKILLADPGKRRSGRILLLTGLIWLTAEILIGYSVCSNMSLGHM